MKRLIICFAMVLIALMISFSAYAAPLIGSDTTVNVTANGGQGGQGGQGGKGGDATAISGSTSNATGIGIGQGGSATATIQKGAVQNTNNNSNVSTNKNDNTNVNTNLINNSNTIQKGAVQNTNTNKQQQGQIQGQQQGQLQGQSQNNGQNIAPTQSVDIQRNLPEITAPPVAPVTDYKGPFKSIFGYVTPWKKVATWNAGMLTEYPTCFWSKCSKLAVGAISKKKASSSFSVVEKPSKKYLGTIVVISADNPLEAWYDVATSALAKGAMEVVEIANVPTYKVSTDGYTLGLSSGATTYSNGVDVVGGAVGVGTGYSSASSEPIEKVKIVFDLYAD